MTAVYKLYSWKVHKVSSFRRILRPGKSWKIAWLLKVTEITLVLEITGILVSIQLKHLELLLV